MLSPKHNTSNNPFKYVVNLVIRSGNKSVYTCDRLSIWDLVNQVVIHPKLNHNGFLMYGASYNDGRLSHITLVERGKYGLKAWEWNLTFYFRM